MSQRPARGNGLDDTQRRPRREVQPDLAEDDVHLVQHRADMRRRDQRRSANARDRAGMTDRKFIYRQSKFPFDQIPDVTLPRTLSSP